MRRSSSFSYEQFLDPDIEYSPVYTWSWVVTPDFESTRKDLDELQRLGIRRFYILPFTREFRPASIPSTMELSYLGEEYMELYADAMEQARVRGMQMWLYDEAGWPSGGANGLVVKEHPEYARTRPVIRERSFQKGDIYIGSGERTAFINDKIMLQDGYVFTEDARVTEYIRTAEIYDENLRSDFCDISRKEAVDTFIRITHEAYKKQIGQAFGKSIQAVFTDEPTMPSPAPFSKEMENGFEEQYGVAICQYLPIITGRRDAENEEEKQAVIQWYDYCSQVFCESYMKNCHDWCRQNDLQYTGHLDIDHKADGSVQGGNYNIMRALRCFDIPGVDAIWRQIYPCDKRELNPWTIWGEKGLYPRYASSAAAQNGSGRAVTESFCVYGSGLTFDQMRYVLDFQAVRGINVYNIMQVPYGDPKGFQRMGPLPYFKEKYACYEDLAVFNRYAERMSYMTSLGVNKTDTALYIPIKDFYVDNLSMHSVRTEWDHVGQEMEKALIPFDICDDDVIEQADPVQLKKGRIVMGTAAYKRIVVSDCRYMSKAAQENLRVFSENGGIILTARSYVKEQFSNAVFYEEIRQVLEPVLDIQGDTEGIRVMNRVCDNAELYGIYNESFAEAHISVQCRDKAYIVNLTEGCIYEAQTEDGRCRLCLRSGEMQMLLYTDAELAVSKQREYQKEIRLELFTVRKTKQFILDEDTAYCKNLQEDAAAAKPGDWSSYTGNAFSGSCIYKTEFTVPENVDTVRMDLGDVRHTCEVFINGQSFGVRVMPPYRYEVSGKDLQNANQLEIRVSNTAANAYYFADTFDQYEKWQLTPYYDTLKMEHADSLSGGLYGPVRILY